jgi:hypothetical protein
MLNKQHKCNMKNYLDEKICTLLQEFKPNLYGTMIFFWVIWTD